MNALLRSSAIIALTSGAIAFINEAASAQTVIHVDIVNGSASPPNFGDGWGTDAYKFLQDALDRADFLGPNPENPVEIWVAAGTYLPTQGGPDASCFVGWNQDYCAKCCSFRLRNNVRIFGGFDGTEDQENTRDWVAAIEEMNTPV